MQELPLPLVVLMTLKVVVGVGGGVSRKTVAYLEQLHPILAAVDQMMRIFSACREPHAHSRLQFSFPLIRDQGRIATQDE